MAHIVVIDNYDSFTYNLVQHLETLGAKCDVVLNDACDVGGIAARMPNGIVISPGPCTPDEAGVSLGAVMRLSGSVPILGVCLGHQSIGHAYGGQIVRAPRLMHGKTDMIHHDGRGLFTGLQNPFQATRYHSLVIEPGTLPEEFEISAWSDMPDGRREIMGVRHKRHPLEGVQFHPESFLTLHGVEILKRFLTL